MAVQKRTYRKRRAPRRRTYKRRTRKTVAVSRSSPIPDKFMTKMRYSSLQSMTTAGIGIPATYSFRMNSIFDPDLSGVGHQPLGHDELTPLYTKYNVTGCSYIVTFTNQSATDYADIAVALRPNTNGWATMSTVLESAYVKRGVLGPESGSRNIRVIRGYCSIAKIRGVAKDKIRDENDYSALIGANPTLTPTLQIYFENQNVANPITVNFRVELIYYVSLYDRKVLTQS